MTGSAPAKAPGENVWPPSSAPKCYRRERRSALRNSREIYKSGELCGDGGTLQTILFRPHSESLNLVRGRLPAVQVLHRSQHNVLLSSPAPRYGICLEENEARTQAALTRSGECGSSVDPAPDRSDNYLMIKGNLVEAAGIEPASEYTVYLVTS